MSGTRIRLPPETAARSPIENEARWRWAGRYFDGTDCGFETGMPVWTTGWLNPKIECAGAHRRLLELAER